MILEKLTPKHPDIPALQKLFEEAFPENECPMSMDNILALLDQLPCNLLGVYPEAFEKFLGAMAAGATGTVHALYRRDEKC